MSTDNLQPLLWNPLLEKNFATIGEKCQSYAYLHKNAEAYFTTKSIFIDLPCIILATLNGAMSIGSQSIFGDDKYASVGVGVVALFTALLQTIGTYFSFSRRAESHKGSSLNYSKLYRFLKIEMSLPRESRMNPKELLKYVKNEYDRLAEISPLIPNKIIIAFKKKFDIPKYKNIAIADETNGLEQIIIYRIKNDTENNPPTLNSPSFYSPSNNQQEEVALEV